jgi:hypothetical protein
MVANGLVSVSPTQLVFEGAVNNDGFVYSVNIGYMAADPNDPSCPCVRRNIVKKTPADTPNQPLGDPTLPYTEATNVFPPGTGAGQSGEDLFAYYDQKGSVVPVTDPTDAATIAKIKTIKINLSLVGRDLETGGQDRASMSATARVN